ncbi:ATP-dependent sacrificial sulfur transferase LarE [bacterium]|nr:ATP-dependent sacrificial sulfur transferase LarE [bacterium]
MVDSAKSKLEQIIRDMEKVMVAFSGGVDSSTLLAMAIKTLGKENVVAGTIKSLLLPKDEFEEAKELCAELGAEQVIIEVDISPLLDNPPERCYICKRLTHSRLWEKAREKGINFLIDGTNADDYTDYRPGLRAKEELGVRSPFAEVGMGKREVRELAKELGLIIWNKPSSPCLATRIPFGERLTREKLGMIEEGEKFIKSLGVKDVRVRCHSDGELARIEVPKEEMDKVWEKREEIAREFSRIGFRFVTVDLEGYRMGSLNPQKEE